MVGYPDTHTGDEDDDDGEDDYTRDHTDGLDY